MSDITEDLWSLPDDPVIIETPKEILSAQAGLLERRTNGILIGVVESKKNLLNNNIRLDFKVYAPSVEQGYTIELLRVEYPVTIYPATIKSTALESESTCQTPQEFKQEVRRILSDATTHKVINALLNLSRS